MYALAAESDYLDMAENAVTEFEAISGIFENTGYTYYQQSAREGAQKCRELVGDLQV